MDGRVGYEGSKAPKFGRHSVFGMPPNPVFMLRRHEKGIDGDISVGGTAQIGLRASIDMNYIVQRMVVVW